MLELVVVSAGLGENSSSTRLGEQLGRATVAALADEGIQAQVRHVELRLLAEDLVAQLTGRVGSPSVHEAQECLLAADGVIVITPIYNGSFSGLFKLFFDCIDPRTMTGRPVMLAATGGSPRHSLVIENSLLPLFYYFKSLIVPTSVFAATTDFKHPGELELRVQQAAARFARFVLVARPPKQLPTPAIADYDDLLS
jgi:FMN reductase